MIFCGLIVLGAVIGCSSLFVSTIAWLAIQIPMAVIAHLVYLGMRDKSGTASDLIRFLYFIGFCGGMILGDIIYLLITWSHVYLAVIP